MKRIPPPPLERLQELRQMRTEDAAKLVGVSAPTLRAMYREAGLADTSHEQEDRLTLEWLEANKMIPIEILAKEMHLSHRTIRAAFHAVGIKRKLPRGSPEKLPSPSREWLEAHAHLPHHVAALEAGVSTRTMSRFYLEAGVRSRSREPKAKLPLPEPESKPPAPEVTAEQLRAYNAAGMTMSEVAEKLGVRRNTVRGWCRSMGIVWQQQHRGHAIRRPELVTAEQLRKWNAEGLTQTEVGKLMGVTQTTVSDWCQSLGVIWQTQRPASKPKKQAVKKQIAKPAPKITAKPKVAARRLIHRLIATYFDEYGLPRENYRSIYAARLEARSG